MRIALLAFAAGFLAAAPAAAQTGFRCPDSIEVAGQPSAPAGFTAETGRSQHRFLQAGFFEGARSDRSGSLAPGSEQRRGNIVTQVFTFASARQRPVYVQCRYRDTTATLIGDIPAGITTCTLIFAYDPRTGAVGTPQRPQLMQCR